MMSLLTAIGLTSGGSSTLHIYTYTIHRTTQLTQTIHRTTQLTQTIHRTTQLTGKSAGRASSLRFIPWHLLLQLRKKQGKTSVRVAEECQLARLKQNISKLANIKCKLRVKLFSKTQRQPPELLREKNFVFTDIPSNATDKQFM
jgi:hypothetical protein